MKQSKKLRIKKKKKKKKNANNNKSNNNKSKGRHPSHRGCGVSTIIESV
jgi:hypothetical protein